MGASINHEGCWGQEMLATFLPQSFSTKEGGGSVGHRVKNTLVFDHVVYGWPNGLLTPSHGEFYTPDPISTYD